MYSSSTVHLLQCRPDAALQTGEGLSRHERDLVVVSPSTVGDMSCMVVNVELKFGQVLASDANIPTGDGQDVATIRRRPRTDGRDQVARQPVQRKWVDHRQEARTGYAQVRYRWS